MDKDLDRSWKVVGSSNRCRYLTKRVRNHFRSDDHLSTLGALKILIKSTKDGKDTQTQKNEMQDILGLATRRFLR